MNSNFKKNVILICCTVLISLGICLLLVSIIEKKTEGKSAFNTVVELNDESYDPAIWGRNFPYQYESYLKNVDQSRTKYGGSEALPRTSSKMDPRSVWSQSKIEEDHRLSKMWEGYAFAIDFREDRGHAFMLSDQKGTQRVKLVNQPGTCLNCHASTYKLMKELGDGDIQKGFHHMNQLPYHEVSKRVKHPVACIDCHDSKTMELRITRPAFLEGVKKIKFNQEGISNYDVNKMASRKEMRTFVCAQCHVEYYFKGKKKELYFPWDKGLKAEQILSYYNEINFKDWTHKKTKATMIKAQHPEFELWSQGVHGRSGVSCVDCHMPYQKVGATKITDHHIQSPLLNVHRACQSCHNIPADQLVERVHTIQDNHFQIRELALNALMDLINLIDEKSKAGIGEERLDRARKYHREASFYVDFVEAENSTGFHAPQEAARILAMAMDLCRKGVRVLNF